MANQQNHTILRPLDMLNALRYELPWFIIVFTAFLLLGTFLIYHLPSIYTARAEVMIEPAGIYSNTEELSKTDEMTRRAHAILKSLMTSENIEKILIKHKQLSADASLKEKQSAISAFRKHTLIDFDNVEVINQKTGKEGMYSQGLFIEHEGTSPDLVYEITQELTDQLLNSTNIKMSKEDQQKLNFLKSQIETAEANLEQTEQAVASFKEKNATHLPEVKPIAIRRLDDLETRLTKSNETLKSLRRSSADLNAELATKKQQVTLYSSDGARIPGLEEKLLVLKNELAEKSTVYTDEHPDIKSLEQEIAKLEKSINQNNSQRKKNTQLRDPVYSLLLTRLVKIQEEILYESRIKEETRTSLEEVNEQLERMPFVEQELQRLEREHEFATKKYKELEEDLVKLEINSGRRDANLLGQFQLLEQPVYPVSPTKPKKKILLIVLFILSGSIGYLAALVIYLVHDRINNTDEIEMITNSNVYIIPDFNQSNSYKDKLFKSQHASKYKKPGKLKTSNMNQQDKRELASTATIGNQNSKRKFKVL